MIFELMWVKVMLRMPGAGGLLHDAYEDGEAGHGYHIELVWVAEVESRVFGVTSYATYDSPFRRF
jgi:hypothetical protein